MASFWVSKLVFGGVDMFWGFKMSQLGYTYTNIYCIHIFTCLCVYGSKLYCFQKVKELYQTRHQNLMKILFHSPTQQSFFEEKTHLQRNISHIDRPHPSQSKLLPLGLQIIRSQFIDHGISRLFPLAGQNEKHRIQ